MGQERRPQEGAAGRRAEEKATTELAPITAAAARQEAARTRLRVTEAGAARHLRLCEGGSEGVWLLLLMTADSS